MTASEGSFVGIAKQVGKGTPNTTDAAFQYFLFSEGSMSPNNLYVPLDQEVGGGALLRNIIKAGVMSAGQFSFIPRPSSLGHFLMGVLGADTPVGGAAPYTHTFEIPADQFSVPYYTFRVAPGNMWGEQFQDCRIAGLSLNWKAGDYVRGQIAVVGGLPTPGLATTDWGASTRLDGGPQFIAPVSVIELPTATPISVLSGSIAMQLNIPLEEQWVVGSYSPDDFDVNSRVYTVSLVVKITDENLYEQMAYDPDQGGTWSASIYKEADLNLQLVSDEIAGGTTPFSLTFKGNAQNEASGEANIAWSISPISLRAGRQVIATMTGTVLADSDRDPINAVLVNDRATTY